MSLEIELQLELKLLRLLGRNTSKTFYISELKNIFSKYNIELDKYTKINSKYIRLNYKTRHVNFGDIFVLSKKNIY